MSDTSRQFGRARQLTQNRRFPIIPSVCGEAIRAIGHHSTPLAFSVVPSWGVPVVPSRGMSVIPTGGVSVVPPWGLSVLPSGGVSVLPSWGVGVIPTGTRGSDAPCCRRPNPSPVPMSPAAIDAKPLIWYHSNCSRGGKPLNPCGASGICRRFLIRL